MSPLHRLWQTLPRGLRREALFTAMRLVAPRPTPDALFHMPVTIAGYHSASTGLGEGVRLLTGLLAEAGLPTHIADLTAAHQQGHSAPVDPGPAGPGTLLMHVNGPMLPWAMKVLGRRVVSGKRVIAYWLWELPDVPKDWLRGLAFAHEIWVPTEFIAAAMRRIGAGPVRILPYPVARPEPLPMRRSDFGLPEDAFLTLTVLNAESSIARKNPLAAVHAHHAAFGDRPDRILVIKVHGTRGAGMAWRQVADAIKDRRNVVVIDRFLTRPEMWALQAQCDVLLSLHRSEGFGLAIAEAMALGKPVIATGWSGNVDFMPIGSSCLVPWQLVSSHDPQKTYDMPHSMWAEADIGTAADMLRTLAADPEARQELGAAAKVASESLSFARLAELVRNMLAQPPVTPTPVTS